MIQLVIIRQLVITNQFVIINQSKLNVQCLGSKIFWNESILIHQFLHYTKLSRASNLISYPNKQNLKYSELQTEKKV